MTGFIELQDSEGANFVVPKSSLGIAFIDLESGLLTVEIGDNAYTLNTQYSEYVDKLDSDTVR